MQCAPHMESVLQKIFSLVMFCILFCLNWLLALSSTWRKCVQSLTKPKLLPSVNTVVFCKNMSIDILKKHSVFCRALLLHVSTVDRWVQDIHNHMRVMGNGYTGILMAECQHSNLWMYFLDTLSLAPQVQDLLGSSYSEVWEIFTKEIKKLLLIDKVCLCVQEINLGTSV